ncbi:MAG TPA: hypothetical protein VFI58_09465 [Xanthobacteraceae bacterium]|jgi:hypothetical protein|nr:hypothetical protein [Xanthobacteraceae bacterium]
MRNPIAIQRMRTAVAVGVTVSDQISDEDFGGRSSRMGSALASVRNGGTSNGMAARENAAVGIET